MAMITVPRPGGRTRPRLTLATLAFFTAIASIPNAAAQTDSNPGHDSTQRSLDTTGAPTKDFSSSAVNPDQSNAVASTTLPEAPRTQRYPRPGQPAPVLTAGDKVQLARTGTLSPFAATGWIFAAGYEQLTNTAPNWGNDRGAFGLRLGDAAIRATTEDFLSDGVLAPLLHLDPRYYRLGHGHKALARVLYAATRPIITRTDGGRTVPNFSLMGGNLAGSALTNLYYPSQNRSVAQTFATFGSGLGGSAVGFGIAEFFGGILFDHNWHARH